MERERERERERVNTKYFLIELRKNILNLTINDFIFQLGWSNEKYYSKIVNGFYENGSLNKKYSNPTINYIFGGINHAMYYFDNWKNKKDEIEKLIKKYFLMWS